MANHREDIQRLQAEAQAASGAVRQLKADHAAQISADRVEHAAEIQDGQLGRIARAAMKAEHAFALNALRCTQAKELTAACAARGQAWDAFHNAQRDARDAQGEAKAAERMARDATRSAPVLTAPARLVMPEAEVRAKSMDPHYWPAVDLYLCVRTPEPVDTSRYPVERLRQAIEHQEAMDRLAAREAAKNIVQPPRDATS